LNAKKPDNIAVLLDKAHSFLIVYNVASYDSFKLVDKFLKELSERKGLTKSGYLHRCLVIIVGKGGDLHPRQRQVRYWEGQELAKKWKVGFVEVSAGNQRLDVESLFLALTELYLSMTSTSVKLVE
jgi:hypothetical protein